MTSLLRADWRTIARIVGQLLIVAMLIVLFTDVLAETAQAAYDRSGAWCPSKRWFQPKWYYNLLMGLRGCPTL